MQLLIASSLGYFGGDVLEVQSSWAEAKTEGFL